MKVFWNNWTNIEKRQTYYGRKFNANFGIFRLALKQYISNIKAKSIFSYFASGPSDKNKREKTQNFKNKLKVFFCKCEYPKSGQLPLPPTLLKETSNLYIDAYLTQTLEVFV